MNPQPRASNARNLPIDILPYLNLSLFHGFIFTQLVVVDRKGFEPLFRESKSRVLPLDDLPVHTFPLSVVHQLFL